MCVVCVVCVVCVWEEERECVYVWDIASFHRVNFLLFWWT